MMLNPRFALKRLEALSAARMLVCEAAALIEAAKRRGDLEETEADSIIEDLESTESDLQIRQDLGF